MNVFISYITIQIHIILPILNCFIFIYFFRHCSKIQEQNNANTKNIFFNCIYH